MATIIDVENESGVSKSTISRFLQGKRVTEENRVKIEKAIKKLDYRLNPIASGLKSSKTKTIGAVIPDITDYFFPPIIKEFESYMSDHGYHTILSDYGNDKSREINQLELLIDKKVDGIVLASDSDHGTHIEACLRRGIPVVLLDRLISGLECDSVTVDNYQASFNAINRCINMGHRNIGAVHGTHHTDRERMRGFKEALMGRGLDVNTDFICEVKLEKGMSEQKIRELIGMANGPSLIFCSNIYIGNGALKVRLKDGLRIPEDISFIVFDDLSSFPNHDYISLIKPEFSSINQPLYDLGRSSAKLLLERLELGMDDYKPMNIELKTAFKLTPSVKEIK
ncbi:MAG: LacI family DNA-binding transcriptional regulator [Spirochaetales bacterium]|nr:LacI family DNA-binding transcriptional regulator [Spirochaetales bacterium]